LDGTETGWGRPAEPGPRWRALLDRARHGSRTAEEPAEPPPAADEPAERRRPAAGVQPLPVRPSSPAGHRPWAADPPRGESPRPEPQRPESQRPDQFRPDQLRADHLRSDQLRFDHLGPETPRPDALRPDPLRPDPLRPDSLLPDRLRPEPPRTAPEQRPVNPLDRRPVNPLDRRAPARPAPPPVDPRPLNPLDPRPVNPLEARRQSRIAEGFHGRAEAEQPHSFFNPATRPAPPSAPPPAAYRAAASVGSAAVLPPVAPAPTSPAPARIEWRQAAPEQDTDRAVALMRRKLGTPRVLTFANPKGGVHKTTATVLAAATIGSVRGRGVLAWDDNELRGTLGLRAGSARHARTIRHLVGDLMQIENMHGDELMRELDDYLRHASDGSYDVLAGEENPRFAQRLDKSTVRRVMDLLRRTHDVICVDTGNNVESVNWQTVMGAADQLVITTVPREDAAFTADWMLDLLNDTGQEDLVKNAVTLISCPSPGPLPLLEDLKKHFATRTRAVAVVPYDPALEVGSSIEYSELQPETRAAWLRAASTMIEPFTE
jgi:MinD-like ATPase involved in chromosome partitioning or flagellar assembly